MNVGANIRFAPTLTTFPCHSERQRRISFCYFWLDPKVTQRSRLRALRTPSRRSQAGKSGNLLRFGQPDFLSPCSLLRRLTARGRRTNAEGVRGGIPHYVRNDKGWCAHSRNLRNLRSDIADTTQKRANTRFAPTRHNIIQLLMVNCQLSCRVHGTYCAHLRNSRSDKPDATKKGRTQGSPLH